MKNGDEKRLSPRRRWRAKVVFENEFGEALLYLHSKDISTGGLFLEKAPPLKLGALVFLSFVLPKRKRPIRVTGQVVRLADKGGTGIRFIDMDDAGFRVLSRFVQR